MNDSITQLMQYNPENQSYDKLKRDIKDFEELYEHFSNIIKCIDDNEKIQEINGILYEIQNNWIRARMRWAEHSKQEISLISLKTYLARKRIASKRKNKSKKLA